MPDYNREDFLLLEEGSFLEFESIGLLLLESSEFNPGVPITNPNVFYPNHTGNTVCSRSGEKCLPGELIKDPYSRNLVKKKYADSSQQYTGKYRSLSKGRSKRPEQDDTFISTPVTIDDL